MDALYWTVAPRTHMTTLRAD